MGVHQAATRLTHQLLPAVAQQCILGRQPNQSHGVWGRAALVFWLSSNGCLGVKYAASSAL